MGTANISVETAKFMAEEIIQRGNQALVDALGAAGAFEFLKVYEIVYSLEGSDQPKLLIQVRGDRRRDKITLNFDQSVSKITLSTEAMVKFANNILDACYKTRVKEDIRDGNPE